MPSIVRQGGDPRPFEILTVCTGNICRSPLAEQLLSARLGEAGLHRSTAVVSAGLASVVGAPMEALSAEISARLCGRSSEGFRSRQISPSIASSADLILTMTKEQRDLVAQKFPRALQRTFTLTEFAKLLALDEPLITEVPENLAVSFANREGQIVELLRARTLEFSRKRSRARLVPSDDVVDPYRRDREVHELVGQQISLASSQIAHNFASWASDALRPDRLSA